MTSVIFDAIVSGATELLQQTLLGNRHAVNDTLVDGTTPLNLAILQHQPEIVQLLLEHGSDVNLADSFRVDGCCRKPIHYACAEGNFDLVLQLIEENDVEVDEMDYSNSTPLHHAAVNGSLEIVDYLVSKGCDIHVRSNSGRTAFWKSVQNGHQELAHLLFALGSNVNNKNQVGETVLFECVRRSELTCLIPDLIHFGIDLGSKDLERNTVLHAAAVFGNTEAGELCLDAGADVNALNDYRNTPLHNASLHDQVAFQVLLLNRNGDLTITNVSGQSSLYLAMLHCQSDSTRLLVSAGAKLTGKEVKMYEQYVSVRNSLYTSFLAWSMELTRSCPLSLKTLCRISIRKQTESPILSNVTRLGLPSVLADYLLFSDFIASDMMKSCIFNSRK